MGGGDLEWTSSEDAYVRMESHREAVPTIKVLCPLTWGVSVQVTSDLIYVQWCRWLCRWYRQTSDRGLDLWH